MPARPEVRGLRRVDLLSPDPMAAAVFYRIVLDWSPVAVRAGVDCWVGNRRCAYIRTPRADETTGFRLVFAGAPMDCSLTGPDNALVQVTKGRAQHGPQAPEPRPGEPCWAELATTDPDRADAFWTATLGWTLDGATYLSTGRPIAGRAEATTGLGWLCYFAVTDLDEVAGLATERGGEVERVDHPSLGKTMLLTDETGTRIGLAEARSWG
ncbi:VOC family protein [Saccharopolyspora tripterygii]